MFFGNILDMNSMHKTKLRSINLKYEDFLCMTMSLQWFTFCLCPQYKSLIFSAFQVYKPDCMMYHDLLYYILFTFIHCRFKFLYAINLCRKELQASFRNFPTFKILSIFSNVKKRRFCSQLNKSHRKLLQGALILTFKIT